MTTFFCPNCWKEIPGSTEICPHCGIDITRFWTSMNYEQKLIHALGHPEPTTVMRAAWLLGERGLEEAVPALVELTEKTDDIYIILEAVRALGKINTPASRKALRSLSDHSAAMIRREVKEILKKNQP
ncbi:MAG: HEAT repeat domain-containing protein [Deltaproteobacteria bacterium]|nr:MAG: HEAT repeat domain-containing protein [Deltaproteobacteria bacterium]